MPAGDVFFDSNVLLYAHQFPANAKTQTAALWLKHVTLYSSGRTNLQLLNEVSNVLLKKRRDLSNEQIWAVVDDLAFLGDKPIGWEEIILARSLRMSTHYSWWDCLLLASAIELGCSHFLSEDLQDGHEFAGLTVINPFLHAPETLFGPYQD